MGQRSWTSKKPCEKDIVSGLMLTNSSSIVHLLQDISRQYDKLMSKNAFLNNYFKSDYEQECGDIVQEFQDSREIVEALMEEYRLSESLAYMEEDYEDAQEDNHNHNHNHAWP